MIPKVVVFRKRKGQAYRAAGEGYDGPLAPLPIEQPERRSTEATFETAAAEVWKQLQVQIDWLRMQQKRQVEFERRVERAQYLDKRRWMIAVTVAVPLLALLNVLLWRFFI